MEELMARSACGKLMWQATTKWPGCVRPGGTREWQNLTSAHSLSWLRPHANRFFANKRRAGRKWAAAAAQQRPLLLRQGEFWVSRTLRRFRSRSHDKAIWSFSLTLLGEAERGAVLGSEPSRRTLLLAKKWNCTYTHAEFQYLSFARAPADHWEKVCAPRF